VSTNLTETDRTEVTPRAARQDRSAVRMLGLANAAADRGDYGDALAWLGKLDEMGHRLDPVYEGRRVGWRLRTETGRVGSSQWFG
jgi:hypothetical protein